MLLYDAHGKPIGENQSQDGTVLSIPVIDLPRDLETDFVFNPKLRTEFIKAVSIALSDAMNTPETRPATITASLLKEWVQQCYKCMLVLRMDMKWSLKKCCDALPRSFMESLLQSRRPEDVAEQAMGERNMWSGTSPARVIEVDPTVDRDITEDIANEDQGS